MAKRRKPQTTYAYTTVNRAGYLNPFHVHAYSDEVRGTDQVKWAAARQAGWRLIRVKLVAAGKPHGKLR
jgi:hypothetical protein